MEDTKAEKKENRVTVAGNFSYLFFFLGLNVLYGIVRLILQIYLTNTLGIAAATVGFLFLVVKIWDAVNDPIFGIIIDKVEFKKGKFMPWIKLSTFLIPIATAFLFFCPISLPLWLKIGWVGLAYVVWDAAYTFCDAPISAMPIAMTDNIKERTALIFTGRIGAPFSIFFYALLPQMAGIMGYGPAILILSVFAMGVMLPFSYTAKERFSVRSEEGESVKSILLYMVKNKYLLIFFTATFMSVVLNLSGAVGMYVAVYNLGNPGLMSLNIILTYGPMIPAILLKITLLKNVDKYAIFVSFQIIAILLCVVMYFVGYKSIPVYVVLMILKNFFLCMNLMLIYAFSTDCATYGTYKTGTHAEGLTFSIQTFIDKIGAAIPGALAMFILGALGYISSTGNTYPEQPQVVVDTLWALFTWVTSIGYLIQLLILVFFYKLRDAYVKVMSDCNNGLISREEAEKLLPSNL